MIIIPCPSCEVLTPLATTDLDSQTCPDCTREAQHLPAPWPGPPDRYGSTFQTSAAISLGEGRHHRIERPRVSTTRELNQPRRSFVRGFRGRKP